MTKLTEWMSGSSDNRKFIAGVAALALTGSAYVAVNSVSVIDKTPEVEAYAESVAMQTAAIENEFETLGENYWHLHEMLENGDINGAIELASSMKEHIADVRDGLRIGSPYTVSSAILDKGYSDDLNALQGVYEKLETALKNDNLSLFSDVVAKIDSSLHVGDEEEYGAASVGM